MDPDGRMEWTDGRRQNYIPPTSSGDNQTVVAVLTNIVCLLPLNIQTLLHLPESGYGKVTCKKFSN